MQTKETPHPGKKLAALASSTTAAQKAAALDESTTSAQKVAALAESTTAARAEPRPATQSTPARKVAEKGAAMDTDKEKLLEKKLKLKTVARHTLDLS